MTRMDTDKPDERNFKIEFSAGWTVMVRPSPTGCRRLRIRVIRVIRGFNRIVPVQSGDTVQVLSGLYSFIDSAILAVFGPRSF